MLQISLLLLQVSGLINPITYQASLYMVFLITVFLDVYVGWRITAFFLMLVNKQWDYRPLLRHLKPSAMRGYLLGILGVAYIVSTIERFGHISLVQMPAWVVYKDVLVEVLISFAGIEAGIEAWRNRDKEDRNLHIADTANDMLLKELLNNDRKRRV